MHFITSAWHAPSTVTCSTHCSPVSTLLESSGFFWQDLKRDLFTITTHFMATPNFWFIEEFTIWQWWIGLNTFACQFNFSNEFSFNPDVHFTVTWVTWTESVVLITSQQSRMCYDLVSKPLVSLKNNFPAKSCTLGEPLNSWAVIPTLCS